jgi:DNA topoisomerase-1
MKLAQELYEGIKLGEEGTVGLITYIRTDSLAVAPEAQQAARAVVTKFWGEAYLPPTPPIYQTQDKTAQEAHEAIRPTDPWRTPKAVEPYLSPQQYQLYRLIWRRFIASQMKPAIYDTVTVDVETLIAGSPTVYLFRATGSTLRFAGFLKVYGVDADAEEARSQPGKPRAGRERDAAGEDNAGVENEKMPELVVGDALTLHQLLPKQHFTQPPKRYTEAQLIGALKKLGLGRPSTYATIVETLKDRKYVDLDQKRLYPTPLGFQVCELLEKHVHMAIDVGFTARMEEDLDRIARGETDRLTMMHRFYGPFKTTVEQAMASAAAERKPASRQSGPKTPPGVGRRRQKSGRRTARPGGQKRTKALPASAREGQTCPECGQGTLVVKNGKYGPFLGCSGYASGCRYTEKISTTTARNETVQKNKK